MKVVIMAGGKGTRIASINSEVPKPMIVINGKPILQYQIEFCKNNGLNDIILVVGHLKEKIMDYFKNGDDFKVNITYIEEDEPLGTAGAFYYLKKYIKNDEDFILLNGDIVFDININKLISFHISKKSLITLCTHPNSHPYDSSIIMKDENDVVMKWISKEEERTYYQNRVNSGIHIINGKVLKNFNTLKKVDFDREVVKPLINSKKVFAYDTPEYIKDMGTPERYYQVSQDLKKGLVKTKSMNNKQKAFFIDRDGTINDHVGFLTSIDDFNLKPTVSDGIKLINNSGYLAIVITNQPVIARGEITKEYLREIHNKMETLLGEKGAYIDGLYYCPHHPDSGYPGEIKELKIECECRKPKTLLVERACKDFNIDINNCFVIGDSDRDKQLADNLNIPFLHVDEKHSFESLVKEVL